MEAINKMFYNKMMKSTKLLFDPEPQKEPLMSDDNIFGNMTPYHHKHGRKNKEQDTSYKHVQKRNKCINMTRSINTKRDLNNMMYASFDCKKQESQNLPVEAQKHINKTDKKLIKNRDSIHIVKNPSNALISAPTKERKTAKFRVNAVVSTSIYFHKEKRVLKERQLTRGQSNMTTFDGMNSLNRHLNVQPEHKK